MRANSFLALYLLAAGAGWTQDVSIDGRLHEGSAAAEKDSGERQARSQLAAPSRLVADLEAAPEFGLPPLEAEALPLRQVRVARRVGRVRPLATDGIEKGAWTALPDGRFVWRLAIRSPEAAQLRIHFTGFKAGSGKVWIYSDHRDERVQEFSGQGLFGDGDFWTSTVSAERVTIEYLAENGLRQDEIPFQIAEIGHLWEPGSVVATQSARIDTRLSLAKAAAGTPPSGLSLAAVSTGAGREIAGCHLDVACFPEFRSVATGVARILFADQGGVYSCSGALVNTKSGNGTPLFLTATPGG